MVVLLSQCCENKMRKATKGAQYDAWNTAGTLCFKH